MGIFLLSPGSRLSPLRSQQGISVWPGFWDFGAATFARFRRFHPKDSTQLAILWLFQICVAVMGWDGMRIQHDSSHGVKSEAWMTAMMSFPSSVEVLQVRWPFEGLAFMVARF